MPAPYVEPYPRWYIPVKWLVPIMFGLAAGATVGLSLLGVIPIPMAFGKLAWLPAIYSSLEGFKAIAVLSGAFSICSALVGISTALVLRATVLFYENEIRGTFAQSAKAELHRGLVTIQDLNRSIQNYMRKLQLKGKYTQNSAPYETEVEPYPRGYTTVKWVVPIMVGLTAGSLIGLGMLGVLTIPSFLTPLSALASLYQSLEGLTAFSALLGATSLVSSFVGLTTAFIFRATFLFHENEKRGSQGQEMQEGIEANYELIDILFKKKQELKFEWKARQSSSLDHSPSEEEPNHKEAIKFSSDDNINCESSDEEPAPTAHKLKKS